MVPVATGGSTKEALGPPGGGVGGGGMAVTMEGNGDNKTVARDGERQVTRALEVVDRAGIEAGSVRDCRESGQDVCRI